MDYMIFIERLRSVYRASEGAGDPEAARRRFDDIARTRLPAALDHAIGRALAGLGIGPEAEIAVDQLAIRIRIRGDADDNALVEGWAKAVAEAIAQRLAPVLARGRGQGVGKGAVLFPDRFEAERAYLVDRFVGVKDAWWYRPVLGGRQGHVPAPREVIGRWIQESPERVPETLSALVLASGFVPADVLSDDEAFALADAIETARRERLHTIAAELHPARHRATPAGSEEASAWDTRLRDGPSDTEATARATAVPGFGSAASADAVAWLLAEPQRLSDLLSAAESNAIATMVGQGYKRLLLTCLLLARHPSIPALARFVAVLKPPGGADPTAAQAQAGEAERAEGRQEPSPAAPDLARRNAGDAAADPSLPAVAEADTPSHRENAGSNGEPHGPVLLRTPEPAQREDLRAEQAEQKERGPAEYRIGCGGLLFLVRRVAASPLVDHHHGVPLEERLVALGQIALGRVLALLPEGARRAAFERERPVLQVFSGAPGLPDEMHVVPQGAVAGEVTAWLDGLTAELPADLDPCPDGLLATYGADPEPFKADHPHRALAHLLLRPGRLSVTRTRADLVLPARAVDVRLRKGGWDIDPGFIPHLGRVIRFHYE